MLCDVVWTGSLQYRITTNGGMTANETRRAHAEKVKWPNSAMAHSAHTHRTEIVAFMCFDCMMEVYRLCAALDVLKCTPAWLDRPLADERCSSRSSCAAGSYVSKIAIAKAIAAAKMRLCAFAHVPSSESSTVQVVKKTIADGVCR